MADLTSYDPTSRTPLLGLFFTSDQVENANWSRLDNVLGPLAGAEGGAGGALDARVAALEATVATLQTTVTDLEARVAALEAV
jgi:hypothetical protein